MLPSAMTVVCRHTRLHPPRRAWPRCMRSAILLTASLWLWPQGAGSLEISTPRDDPFAVVTATGSNMLPFRKWRSVLQRYEEEQRQAKLDGCQTTAPTSTGCLYAEWARFLDGLRSLSRQEQLRAVNHAINQRPYTTDMANWAMEDYWESPAQFLAKSGDCEDFAILKYLSLRRLGWQGEALRIAAVFDTRLNIGHAIVIVEDAGRAWILDSQIPDVVEASQIDHYQPLYSLTETSWRLHRPIEQATGSAG